MDDAMNPIGGHETIRITDAESQKSQPLSKDPLIGQMLDKRYLIIRELGHGGFGSVYLASDEKVMSKPVVVKVLKETGNEWSLKKFRHEIEALARIDHSGIIGIVDTGQLSEGNPYIVMRYVNGVTLRSCITAEGMSLERASNLIKQIGSALAAAHEKGILHRDLKPENIMVQGSGVDDEQITIVDFGLAKIKKSVVASSTVEPSVFGTLYYMSPEQFRGRGLSPASDIYSLGIIAYEMVTGRRPFNADTVGQLVDMQQYGVKIKPKDLRPALPERSQKIILQALLFDPADRPQDARRFADDLGDSLVDDHEVEIRRLTQPVTNENDLDQSKASTLVIRNRKTLVLGSIALLIVCISAAVIWKTRSAWVSADTTSSMNNLLVNSVAVLPFRVKSTNPDAEYISDGITETLIDELSQLPSMKRVIARTSVFRFKDREVDPQIIGHELQVGAVLFGQITQQGDEIAITAELVSTDDRHLWGGQYTLTIANTLAKQKEISRAIALGLQQRLTGNESPRAKNYPQNNEAYLLYLKGRYFLNKRDFKSAMDCFQQAINNDAGYSLAYAGLADCYSATNAQPSDTMPKAEAAALKALSLDDTLAEGHASLALVMFRYEWNWPDAEREFKRAIELNPNYAAAHQWYSLYLLANDRSAEAMEEITRAQQLDPLSVRVGAIMGAVLLFSHQYDNAIAQWKKTLEIDPDVASVHALLRTAYQQKGMFDEAYAEAQKEFPARFTVHEIEGIKQAYGRSGYEGVLARELEIENERSKKEYIPSTGVARIYVALGQKDQAFASLEKAYQNREDGLVYIKADPRYDKLHSDPRFLDLLRRVGLAH